MSSVVSLAKPKSVSFSVALLSFVVYSRFSGCHSQCDDAFYEQINKQSKQLRWNFSDRLEQRYLDIPVSDVHAVEVFYRRTDVVHYL